MAEVTFNAEQTQTRNRARLLSVRFERIADATGALTGQVSVISVTQIGHFAGGVFTEHTRVHHTETRSLAQVSSHYGATHVNTIEQKTLERLQALELLPAGTIT